jgi:hypothetical protein
MERSASKGRWGRWRGARRPATALAMSLALALGLEACSSAESESVSNYKDDQGRQCHVARFKQPQAPITTKIDVLFVTDTSGSLDQERGAIADGILDFIAALPRTTEVNVGVLLAHGSSSARTGKLFQTSDGEPVVLKSSELAESALRAHLHRKLTEYSTDWDLDSDGGEEGLYSTLQLLSGGNLSKARSQGFFRSDAALAVIFIADENDICAVYPTGVTPVPDPEGREAKARARDCGSISAGGVLSRLAEVKGEMPLVVSGVMYTDAGHVPAGPENEVGYGYTDIIALANGVSVDMSHAGDIAAGVGRIGGTSAQEMLLYHDFDLTHESVAEESIKVSVDGAPTAHVYTRETRTVHLTQAGSFGSQVTIDYCESR